MLSTSDTLLQRVRKLDPSAWERLCQLYGPIVYGWCRRGGLQDADAADATQEAFRSVYLKIGQFQQQGNSHSSFRAWLRAIVVNQVRLHFRQSGRQAAAVGSVAEQWAECASPDSTSDEADVRQRLVHRALDLIRRDFMEQTWQVFERTTLQRDSIQSVASDLGLSLNAVRQARFRVMKRLRQELDGLL